MDISYIHELQTLEGGLKESKVAVTPALLQIATFFATQLSHGYSLMGGYNSETIFRHVNRYLKKKVTKTDFNLYQEYLVQEKILGIVSDTSHYPEGKILLTISPIFLFKYMQASESLSPEINSLLNSYYNDIISNGRELYEQGYFNLWDMEENFTDLAPNLSPECSMIERISANESFKIQMYERFRQSLEIDSARFE